MSPDDLRVSIIVVTRDGRRLDECLDSCLRQDWPHLEVIVAQMGAPEAKPLSPGTVPGARWLPTRDADLPEVLTFAHEAATGTFITWLTDVHAFEPDAIRTMATRMIIETALGMVLAPVALETPEGRYIRPLPPPPGTAAGQVPDPAALGPSARACFLYRACVWRETGFDPLLPGAVDTDFYLHVTGRCEVLSLTGEPLMRYRLSRPQSRLCEPVTAAARAPQTARRPARADECLVRAQGVRMEALSEAGEIRRLLGRLSPAGLRPGLRGRYWRAVAGALRRRFVRAEAELEWRSRKRDLDRQLLATFGVTTGRDAGTTRRPG